MFQEKMLNNVMTLIKYTLFTIPLPFPFFLSRRSCFISCANTLCGIRKLSILCFLYLLLTDRYIKITTFNLDGCYLRAKRAITLGVARYLHAPIWQRGPARKLYRFLREWIAFYTS